MRTAAEVQRWVEAALRGEVRRTPVRHYPAPPPEELVIVEALTASWCVGAKPVVVGESYCIPLGEAHRLELLGKGRRV